jgi:hypothetical protein
MELETKEISVNSQEHVSTEEKPSRARKCLVKCPHCGEELPRVIEKQIAREMRRKAAVTSGAGRKPEPRPCIKCGKMFGARAIRLHEPMCSGRLMFPHEEAVVLAVFASDKGEFTKREVRDLSGFGWSILGATLKRLEKSKKIIGRWDDADETKRQKNRLYRLAGKGNP